MILFTLFILYSFCRRKWLTIDWAHIEFRAFNYYRQLSIKRKKWQTIHRTLISGFWRKCMIFWSRTDTNFSEKLRTQSNLFAVLYLSHQKSSTSWLFSTFDHNKVDIYSTEACVIRQNQLEWIKEVVEIRRRVDYRNHKNNLYHKTYVTFSEMICVHCKKKSRNRCILFTFVLQLTFSIFLWVKKFNRNGNPKQMNW